jgi:hypothetical protein
MSSSRWTPAREVTLARVRTRTSRPSSERTLRRLFLGHRATQKLTPSFNGRYEAVVHDMLRELAELDRARTSRTRTPFRVRAYETADDRRHSTARSRPISWRADGEGCSEDPWDRQEHGEKYIQRAFSRTRAILPVSRRLAPKHPSSVVAQLRIADPGARSRIRTPSCSSVARCDVDRRTCGLRASRAAHRVRDPRGFRARSRREKLTRAALQRSRAQPPLRTRWRCRSSTRIVRRAARGPPCVTTRRNNGELACARLRARRDRRTIDLSRDGERTRALTCEARARPRLRFVRPSGLLGLGATKTTGVASRQRQQSKI